MPANRKLPAITAPYDRWVLLGKLLDGRRRVLGYTYRAPGFERDRGVNRRLAADFEKAAPKRVNHFTEGSLRLIAHGYQVTYESVIAVLRGEADALAVPAPGWTPPTDDAARAAANQPWFDAARDEIAARRFHLAARGVRDPAGRPPSGESWDPSGAQMFGEGTDDARAWDVLISYIDVRDPDCIRDRAWTLADMRRRARKQPPNAGSGAAGA